MTTTLHQKIKAFCIEGQFINDAVAQAIKSMNERTLDVQMKDAGYVRVLDLDPHWSTQYNGSDDTWSFKMTMYGSYVGKGKSWQYEGSWQGKLIPRSIPQTTSNQ